MALWLCQRRLAERQARVQFSAGHLWGAFSHWAHKRRGRRTVEWPLQIARDECTVWMWWNKCMYLNIKNKLKMASSCHQTFKTMSADSKSTKTWVHSFPWRHISSFSRFPANESLRRTGLHLSLSASFYLPAFEISRSCRTVSAGAKYGEETVCERSFLSIIYVSMLVHKKIRS